MTKVWLVGKDARTHAIGKRVRSDGGRLYVACDFSNPGLRSLVHDPTDFRQMNTAKRNFAALLGFAKEVRPDLAIIGPEEPLEDGLVDELAKLGIACVGPTKKLAQLESSKSFTRSLLARHRIPGNIEFHTFAPGTADHEIVGYLKALREFVVKADGLMGGKGVKVSGDHLHSVQEALAYVHELFRREPTKPVVIEERVEGEEFSLQSFFDGKTIAHTMPVQDHKRVDIGDVGANTGGMGSYSCADHLLPFLTSDELSAARAINAAVAAAITEELGEEYRGVLYGGFMATADGLRVLEYNARLGDPEAINVLPLLEGNFVEICHAIATGTLRESQVRFKHQASVCKYLVPESYGCPGAPVTEGTVEVPFEDTAHCQVFYAAVNGAGGNAVKLTGSRALAILATADSVPAASEIAETAIAAVRGPVKHRPDIGTAALLQQRVDHLEALRRSSLRVRMQG